MTSACHLCDEAEALLHPILAARGLQLALTDIASADPLIDRYGVRIPVLRRDDSGAELDWPFSSNQVVQFLIDC